MKRALPLIIAAVLTLLAFGSAFTLNTVVGWVVAVPDGSAPSVTTGPLVADARSTSRAAPVRRTARTGKQYIDTIMKRSLFDHTQAGQKGTSGPGEGGLAATSLNLKLIATIVAEPAQYSSAFIAEDSRDGAGDTYGVGAEIMGALLVEIRKKEVVLELDGERQVLKMDDGSGTPTKTASISSSGGNPEIAEGVSEVEENKYEIDRGLVDKYLTDPDALAKMGRARPFRQDGETVGFKLTGIRRDSPAQQIGIRNGDVVHSVNGVPLTSMKEALTAFDTLQNQSSFQFEVTRRGKKITLDYTVK